MVEQIVLLIFLLFFSALFSGSEMALSSLGKLRIKEIIERRGKRAEVLNLWLKEPNRFLTTILIGNNVANIFASVVAAAISIKVFEHIAIGVTTGIMTFLVLVFGEITPKTLAKEHAEKISLFIIRPLHILSSLLSPFIKFFLLISTGIIRLFGGKGSPQTSRISAREIHSLIKAGEREGALEKEEREMIHSVMEFGDTRVDEVMTPRTEIVAVEEEADLREILDTIIKEGHSRIPVYREDIDEICGIVHARDLLSYISPVRKEGSNGVKEGKKEMKGKEAMSPAYFIPESKKLSDLLHEFQRQKNQIAIVIDEYGGTAGLVTLEDLLEEIVGEISDRYEKETTDFQALDTNTFLVNGKMEIERANEEMNLQISEEIEAETMAGFVFHQLGRIPKEGEQFKYKNLLITIRKADERSVSLIQIKKFPPKPTIDERRRDN